MFNPQILQGLMSLMGRGLPQQQQAFGSPNGMMNQRVGAAPGGQMGHVGNLMGQLQGRMAQQMGNAGGQMGRGIPQRHSNMGQLGGMMGAAQGQRTPQMGNAGGQMGQHADTLRRMMMARMLGSRLGL